MPASRSTSTDHALASAATSLPSRPVMRYYGGKWRIAPAIVALMPKHEVYVEPFGGAASVLLQKPRATCEVYNDNYGEVVNVFKQLRDAGDVLLRGLFLTPYSRDEYTAAYEPTSDPIEAARRFVFRSAAGVGTTSFLRRGGFDTRTGGGELARLASWVNLPDALGAVVARLREVVIENRDALEVMSQHDAKHTLHYIDPPYLGEARRSESDKYFSEMLGRDEHVKLLGFCRSMLKGKVMISGYDNPLYDQELGAAWSKVILEGGRDQSNARTRECVWMNFEAPAVQGVML